MFEPPDSHRPVGPDRTAGASLFSLGGPDRSNLGRAPARARLLLASFAVCLLVTAAHAQGQWRMFRAADGLSESLSTALTVSPRGTVWVKHGEVNAISGLDGYVVQRIPAPAERIYRVHQSRAGRIWAVYEEGLLSSAGDAWTRHPLTNELTLAELNQLRAGRPPTLLAAEADRVLMVLPERLVEFRASDRGFTALRTAAKAGLGRFLDLAPAAAGGVWLTAERGVARSSGPLRQLGPESSWTDHPAPRDPALGNLHRPFEDDEGGLTLVGDAPGQDRRVLVHFDGAQWTVRSQPGENLRFAWRDPAPGVFWAVTLNRLLRFEGDQARPVTDLPAFSQILDVAVQPRGVFWLATREGVLRRAPAAWQPPALPPGPPAQPGLVQGLVEEGAGRLWVAAEAGLYSLQNGRWDYRAWPAGFEAGFQAGDGIFVLGDGGLALVAGDRLWRFDPGGDRFEAVLHPAGRRLVRGLRRDEAGALVLLTRPGPGALETAPRLERFDGRNFTEWTASPPLPDTGGDFFFLERAGGGDWWLGTSAGPASARDGRWQFFGTADGYTDTGALCWLELGEGRIWCSGLGKVLEFDGRRWGEVRGDLDHANAMRRTSDGSVWVAANNGLHRFYRDAWLVVGEAEGLPAGSVHSVWEDRQRQLWVGTLRGLTRYVPRADFDPPRTLAIEWEQQGSATGEGTGTLSLAGRDRWQFTPDARLVYSHRLDEGAWSPYSGETMLRLRGLPQGRHQVEVRAMDRNWNVELKPVTFSFRVSVPWYRDQRVVAAGLGGLVLALVAAGVAANRHWRLRRSYADVGRLVEERTRELRRATDALAHSQKMTALGTLAAGVAHDFNNILSIIKGSAQIIAAHPGDHDKVLTRVSRILTMVDQASDVVKAMLGFGTATERTVKPCEVNRIIADTVRLLSDRFRRDVEVRLDLAPELPPVWAAADLLRQMLLNLIFNGADAMDGHGTILVSSGRVGELPPDLVLAPRPAGSWVWVRVVDHGSGIAADILPRIFEPFFTTKSMSTRPGRGLGLYMVHEFAREMGHGLRVESGAGQGTTFTLFVPVAVTDVPVASDRSG